MINLESKTGPELLDLYNGAAASLGEKPVSRFSDKAAAIRRTTEILKRSSEKANAKAAAKAGLVAESKAVPLSALEPGCLSGPDPKLAIRQEMVGHHALRIEGGKMVDDWKAPEKVAVTEKAPAVKALAEAAKTKAPSAPKSASAPSVSNWVRYVSVSDPKYTVRISPKSVERAGAPTDPYGKVMIPATN